MPDQAPPTIRLLVLATPDEADRLIASLRDGGLDVQGTATLEPDQLAVRLAREPCDLILCCTYDPALDLDAVLAARQALTGDLPLILITDQAGEPRPPLTWAMERGARDLTDRGDPLHLRLIVQRELADLKTRRRVRALEEQLHRYEAEPAGEAPAAAASAGVALILDGMHADADADYLRLFGFAAMDDLHAAALLDLIAADAHAAVRDFLRERRSGPSPDGAALRVQCVRVDGSRFPADLTAAPAEVDGEPGLRLTVSPLTTPAPRPERTVPGSAARDALPEYGDLIAAIAAEIGPERRATRPFALFYIAIRTAPNLFGDLGLSRGLGIIGDLSAALVRLCTPLGVPAHLNVDGYGLLAPGLDETGAADLAEHIRARVQLPPGSGDDAAIAAECDIGYVAVPAGPCGEPAALLDAAYRACRGSASVPVRPVSPQKTTSLAARAKQTTGDEEHAMAERVRWALEQGRLTLVFQPIISLMGETQENYSVLLRLIDPDGGLVEAQTFIGAAIGAGLIQQLDRWVIRNAIAALAEHRRGGQAINFFINLAEDSFRDRDLQFWVRDCLREFGVHASWLTLVIQEHLVDPGSGGLGPVVERLKTLGCRIAVSYFGATDRSETLLTGLSPDLVLLLPDYAKGLAADPTKQQRLTMLAHCARETRVKTVVTGVEDAPSLTILWTAGVDYVQGNFLQRPSPSLEISA